VKRDASDKDKATREKAPAGRRFTPSQQLGAFVLFCAVLCGAVGGGIGKLATDDHMSQFWCWAAGALCGVAVGLLFNRWAKRWVKP
jgi:hypothetical protein